MRYVNRGRLQSLSATEAVEQLCTESAQQNGDCILQQVANRGHMVELIQSILRNLAVRVSAVKYPQSSLFRPAI